MVRTVHKKVVAPDGGWGWIIVVAHGINFFLVFSIFQSFGLIYKKEFVRLGFTGAQSSLILTTNGGLCMLCGLINGYLLNRFTVRAISFCSGVLMVSGLVMTAYSSAFYHFVISYGIITSVGIGMAMSSYALAINTYFNKKRSRATAFAITISGIGVIMFPQLASYLLTHYTIRDTMLIISAICAHTFVSASLLQPVEWHGKPEEETSVAEEDNTLLEKPVKAHQTTGINAVCDDIGSVHASAISLNNDHHMSDKVTSLPKSGRFLNTIVKMFDLNLLKDTMFINILLGLSIEYFSDFNFMWLIPFVLIEKDLSIEQTATFMSIYSIADLCLKFCAPFIMSALKQPSRIMLLGSLILVVLVRMFLAFVTTYSNLLVLAVLIGSFRGLRLIYWQLVLPEYTPVERLASAFGLLFSLNGFCMIGGGPLLGLMRDQTGSYKSCVVLLNCIALVTVMMCTAEMAYRKINLRKNEPINISE